MTPFDAIATIIFVLALVAGKVWLDWKYKR